MKQYEVKMYATFECTNIFEAYSVREAKNMAYDEFLGGIPNLVEESIDYDVTEL